MAQSTRNQVPITIQRKFRIHVPQLNEQQKISDFLTGVDDWIENLKQQKENLEAYKKGMMQKIFSQEIRFKDVGGKSFPDWEQKRLGEHLALKGKRNKRQDIDLILSVSNKKGFITQAEQFKDHRVASKNIANYKVVEKEDFAFNPSRINVGSIARLMNYDFGVVSPMYVVFGLCEDLNPVFFEGFMGTHYFKHMVKISCSGSVRESLNFEDLEKFKTIFPSLPEQQKIADFLTSLDEQMKKKQQEIEKAQTWKKGLMQQMFI